jgi:inner membrane protein
MAWWIWLVLGLVLFVLEALTPGGFFLVFFGVGAVVLGLLNLVAADLPFLVQGLLFVGISVVALLLFRRPLLARFQHGMPKGKVDSIVGETALALDEIPVGAMGTAELRGASWTAQNVGDIPIARSARCRIERVDGLTLHIRA